MWTKQNYYSHTEQQIFVHYIPLECFTLFFKTSIILSSNYSCGNRKGLLDHIQTKKYSVWVVTARVFLQRFYSLMKLFFLNSLEQRDTDSLIATIPLWYSLFGVGYVSLRVWNGCIYNLWNITQESYSVRVQVLGNHCAQGGFCKVILLAAPHSVNAWLHSLHHWYIIPISRRLSLRVLVFLNSSLMTSQTFTRFSAISYIVSISLASTGQRFLSAAESARIFSRKIRLARI